MNEDYDQFEVEAEPEEWTPKRRGHGKWGKGMRKGCFLKTLNFNKVSLDEAYAQFEEKITNKFMKIAAFVTLIVVLVGGFSTCALRKLKKLMTNMEKGKY
jgi:hypothetical protein